MRLATSLVFLAAVASSGCGSGMPVSPSPLASSAAPGTRLSIGPSDYHDPAMPAPDPAMPAPDPAPAPTAVAINIVGSSGTAAFAPNPLEVSIGHAVVWTNNDATIHEIVLGDGTMVGTIAPGQSSAPVTLSAAAVTYRCTVHPSMTGTIQDPSVATPTPPPDYNPPPPDDGYGRYY
jgi:plastocyanin